MSQKEKTLRTKAIVLSRTNFQEADRIVRLITPEGQISAIAKGSRRQGSKLASGIELLSVSDVVLWGNKDLRRLVSANSVNFYRQIINDYDSLQFVYDLLKEISRLSNLISDPIWFDVLRQSLEELDKSKLNLNLIENWVYAKFLSVLGDPLNFTEDSLGQPIEENKIYKYDPIDNHFAVDNNGPITANHIKLLRILTFNDLKIVKKIKDVDQFLGALKSILVGRVGFSLS